MMLLLSLRQNQHPWLNIKKHFWQTKHNKMNSFLQQFVFVTNPHDAQRRHEITARLESRFQLYAGDPELDLPKYHPRPLECPTPPEIIKVENNDSQQLVNMLVALRVELAWSDSGERASGFKDADVVRVQTMMDKIKIVNQAVTDDPEIDTPDVDLQEPPANPNNPG